jgi:hypothetical protein
MLHVWAINFLFLNRWLFVYHIPRISSVFECDGRKYMYVCFNFYGTRRSVLEFMYKGVGIWHYRVCPTSPPPPPIRILSLILVKSEIKAEIEFIERINFAWTVQNLSFPLNNADVFSFVFQLYAGFSYSHVQSCTEWHKNRATPASVTKIRFFFFSGNMQWRNNNNNNNNNGINAGTSNISTMNSYIRIAATQCSLGTWFVSRI